MVRIFEALTAENAEYSHGGILVIYCAAMRPASSSGKVVVLLALLAAVAFPADKPEPAPRFHAKTLEGELFTNDSVKGKVLLLEFWTTWCQYCRQEETMVDEIKDEFAPKGLLVLAIDVAESKKKVRKYLEDNPRTTKIVLTEDTNLAAMYEATSYPIYVVINREGDIVGTQRGAGGEGALRELLARAGLEEDEDTE